MASLTIRSIEADVVDALKMRAKQHGRSLEAEIRELLRDAAHKPSPASLRDLADQIAALTPDVPQADSADLVREDRDR